MSEVEAIHAVFKGGSAQADRAAGDRAAAGSDHRHGGHHDGGQCGRGGGFRHFAGGQPEHPADPDFLGAGHGRCGRGFPISGPSGSGKRLRRGQAAGLRLCGNFNSGRRPGHAGRQTPAVADLRRRGAGRDAQCRNLFLALRAVLSRTGDLQRRRGAVPFYVQFQGFDDDFHRNEPGQHLRQCNFDLCVQYGRCGRRACLSGFPYPGRCRHDGAAAQPAQPHLYRASLPLSL